MGEVLKEVNGSSTDFCDTALSTATSTVPTR